MSISGAYALMTTLLLIVPGYVLLAVANLISPRYSGRQIESLVLSLAYGSVILFTFCCFAKFDFSTIELSQSANFASIWTIVIIEVILIGISALAGFILGAIRRSGMLDILINNKHLRLNVSTTQSSWDYMFERNLRLHKDKALYLVIRCKDGTTVYGKYGSMSHASMASDGAREIYLEKTYSGGGNRGPWKEHPNTAGVYIRCEDVSCIMLYVIDDERQEAPVATS